MLEILDSYFNHFRLKYFFKKPLLLLKVARLYANNFLFKSDILQRVELGFDYTCNLNCSHCFAQNMLPDPKIKQPLSNEEILKMISDCVDEGVITINFQGGEPTLSPILFDAIKACKPYKTFITITTNGTLLNKEYLRKLYKAGVDQLLFSIDSMKEGEHDSFRRQDGVFAKAMENLKLAKKMGFVVTISTTVTHQNLHSEGTQKIIEYCIKNKMTLIFQSATPTGNWQNNFEVLITEEDAEYMLNLHKQYKFIRRDLHYSAFRKGCPAVKQFLYITSSGDVLACPFIHISLGNVKNTPISEIRKKGLSIDYFKNYHHTCLAAEDKEFINKYITKTYNKKHLPISEDNW